MQTVLVLSVLNECSVNCDVEHSCRPSHDPQEPMHNRSDISQIMTHPCKTDHNTHCFAISVHMTRLEAPEKRHTVTELPFECPVALEATNKLALLIQIHSAGDFVQSASTDTNCNAIVR